MKLPKPTKKAHSKRLEEWKEWLSIFQKANNKRTLSLIPNAAWLLNDLYWRIADLYLRPVLSTSPESQEEHRIHPYKIISASEITIMMVLPFEISGKEEEQKKLNALFAWFVATQIIDSWETGNTIKVSAEHINIIASYKENIDSSDKYPESFAAEHIKWLTFLNVAIEKPLIINSQCWRLFYIACLSLASKGNLK